MNALWRCFLMLAIAAVGWAPQTQAETVKVGLSKLVSYPGVPIALQRGYFKEQNLDVQMVFFDGAQPIGVGVASGDIDFGVSGLSSQPRPVKSRAVSITSPSLPRTRLMTPGSNR